MEPGHEDRKVASSLPAQDRQKLSVKNGNLEVYIELIPMSKDLGTPNLPLLPELEKWIRDQGIKSDLDLVALQKAIDRAREGHGEETLVSRGRPPKPGQDGYLETLIDLDRSIKPIESGSDSQPIDLRASLIHNVKAGETLAIIHAPTAGEPGIDIYGHLIAAVPGKALEPILGANTQRSLNVQSLIIAQKTGHVRVVEGVLEVQEVYLVPGDIDYATGNISFEKSVHVKGDIKSGFSVESGADLEVTGLVEDCQIHSKGNVRIGGGFTGQGKGLVEAQGDIVIGYVRNQQVKSEKSILIQREAVNSRLQARHSITINGLLAGGKTQARFAVECQVVGTETGTPTQIEAGYDYTLSEEKANLRLEMDRMGKYAKKLADSIEQLHTMKKQTRGLEPWNKELLLEIEGGRSKVDAKIKTLRERFSQLEAQTVEADQATITIFRKAYSGVVLKIGKEMFLIHEQLIGPKTFFAQDGVIQIR